MNTFLEAIKNRRSIYDISNESLLSDAQLLELVETAAAHVPSAFNSQTSRVILLIGDSHKQLWDIALQKLKAIIPEENFKPTNDKIASFAAGYGTILYYEEQDTVKDLQKRFPIYADNFPVWSQQASAMLQFAIWTALEVDGMGVSLQHYNPLIDAEAAKAFQVPESWKLIAQMPFGKPGAPAGEKTFLPMEERVRVFSSVNRS